MPRCPDPKRLAFPSSPSAADAQIAAELLLPLKTGLKELVEASPPQLALPASPARLRCGIRSTDNPRCTVVVALPAHFVAPPDEIADAALVAATCRRFLVAVRSLADVDLGCTEDRGQGKAPQVDHASW